MKRLGVLLLRMYVGPFFMTFFIALFVLVMQFLWKHIDDLAGKGLDWLVIFQLLFYASATLVPLALPLAVLLSSIMTMGQLGENLELVAAKSSGISLLRLLRPLVVFILVVGLGAFLFSNYLMPVANFKAKNLLSAIRSTRPTLELQEGVFYQGLSGVSVFVGKKDPDGKTIYNVMVYDHSRGGTGASRVTLAKKGRIYPTTDETYLVLELNDGIRYDDSDFYLQQYGKMRLFTESFKNQQLWIDMSSFTVDTKSNRDYLKHSYTMMNVVQLQEVYRSIRSDLKKQQLYEANQQLGQMQGRDFGSNRGPADAPTFPLEQVSASPELSRPVAEIDLKRESAMAVFSKPEYQTVMAEAKNKWAGVKQPAEQRIQKAEATEKNLVINRVEWHRKFTLAFACVVFFFIGAPLGAIIRKGGLGLPLILCILIFIGYYVFSTLTEKSAKNMNLDPFWGMWLSSLVLLPIGLFLTLKVSTESPWFRLETYLRWMRQR
jgi:lipopolysaccharide export system permease protein